MAAQGNLVLANGEATPVNKTFSPRGVRQDAAVGMLASYADITGGIAIGFPTVTLSVRSSASKTDVDKRVMTPVLEVVSGSDGGYTPSPKVAYTLMSREQFVLPARSTTAERKNILAFSKNMNADAVMQNAVWNLEAVW
jgi:hypothetical protein